MADLATGCAAGAGAVTAEPKKRQSASCDFVLIEDFEAEVGETTARHLRVLPLPAGIDLTNPKHRTRAAIENAVRVLIEAGDTFYNSRKLRVIDQGKSFTYTRVVKRVETEAIEIVKS